ncbi:hypothetical protein BH11PLA2_BH11PLA2_32440 [soil metagenome]
MPNDIIYGMTQRTKDAVQDLLRSKQRAFGPTAPPARDPGPYLCFVECGNYVSTTGGYRYYYGTCKLFNALTGAFESPGDPDAVWLISDVPLEVGGEPYLCMGTGFTTVSAVVKPGFVVMHGSGEYVRWVKPTSDTATGGITPGKLQEKDGSGGYVDGIDVQLVIRSGDRFIAGQPYLATLNGTTTIDAVEYPVYHANGNLRVVHTVCVDPVTGTTRCDAYFYAAPFKIVENVNCDGSEPPAGL